MNTPEALEWLSRHDDDCIVLRVHGSTSITKISPLGIEGESLRKLVERIRALVELERKDI